MSGTSLDGVDAAYIATDGAGYVEPLAFRTYGYDDGLRARLRSCFGAREKTAEIAAIEAEMTRFHAEIVNDFMAELRQETHSPRFDVIGFHGQTVTHDPARRFTWQLGDGEMLRALTHSDVVYDFRQADVMAGGQGAPLLPIYHAARVASLRCPDGEIQKTPNSLAEIHPLLRGAGAVARAVAGAGAGAVAIVNIGGVSNISWVGAAPDLMEGEAGEKTGGEAASTPLLAFDCGPGNALMDDYMLTHLGEKFDQGGSIAARGQVNEDLVKAWMNHEFFAHRPPKSLDRNAWDCAGVATLPPEDAMASLSEFTARAIAHAARFLPAAPLVWLITGGGRLNHHLMKRLEVLLGAPVRAVDDLGWNGDALEAEGFAYMAVRRLLNLPISFPATTSAPRPLCGGVVCSQNTAGGHGQRSS